NGVLWRCGTRGRASDAKSYARRTAKTGCAPAVTSADGKLRLSRPRRGEGRDGGDLCIARGHDLDAHRRSPEHTHLVQRRADDDAGRADEEDLLRAFVDDLDRGDVAGLRPERSEDHTLAAATLGREVLDR